LLTLASERVIHLDDVRDIPTPERNGNQPTHSWAPLSLIDLAADPPAPPTIGGLLYPGERTVLSGETESMKTWLALILSKAEIDAGFPVCWADLDAMGPGAMLERLTLLGLDQQTIHENFLYMRPSEMLDDAKLTETADTIANRGVRLFVIDAFNPILNLHELEPNATTDIETFWRTIADRICRAGAAPVLLDHVAKNAETRGKYAYGSERKASGAIVHIGFKLLEPLTKGGRGRSLLTVHKDRPGYLQRPTLGRLVIDATDTLYTYQLEPDKSHDAEGAFRPTVLMERVSRKLEEQTEPKSKTWIEENVTGNVDAIRTAIKTLLEDAYAAVQQGPRRATLYTSIRPYREAADTPAATPSSLRPHSVPNLRSSTTRTPSHPLRGTESGADPQDGVVLTPSPSIGDPIPEYDLPPPDDTLQPYDFEFTPNGDWNDL